MSSGKLRFDEREELTDAQEQMLLELPWYAAWIAKLDEESIEAEGMG
jgi:hypothetical protein